MTQRSPVVLITGNSSGIGRAIASAFAAKGYEVFGTSRNPQRNEPIAGVNCCHSTSATRPRSPRRSRRSFSARDASTCWSTTPESASSAPPREFDRSAQALFDTNFFGLIRVTNEVLPHLRAQRSGRIINISSVLGFLPAPYGALYAAS